MGIIHNLKRKFRANKKPERRAFTEEDREKAELARTEKSLERRLLKIQEEELTRLERLQKQKALREQIMALQTDFYEDYMGSDGDDGDKELSPESMFMSILMPAIQQKMMSQQAPANIDPILSNMAEHSNVEHVQFTDDELEHIINGLPAPVRAVCQSAPETTVRKLIRSHLPSISSESENRAVELLKS